MAKRRRRSRLQRLGADVLGMVASARNLTKTALLHLRKEIRAVRNRLELGQDGWLLVHALPGLGFILRR